MILIKLANIKGESKIPGHIGEIEIDSYQFGVVAIHDSPGRSATSADLVISKPRDSSTPSLMEYAAKGSLITRGELLVINRIPGTQAKRRILYKMKGLYIIGFIPRTAFDFDGPRYSEQVQFNFKSLKTEISAS